MMKSACEGPFQTATCSFGTCATCTYLPAAGTSDYSLSKVVVHQGINPTHTNHRCYMDGDGLAGNSCTCVCDSDVDVAGNRHANALIGN